MLLVEEESEDVSLFGGILLPSLLLILVTAVTALLAPPPEGVAKLLVAAAERWAGLEGTQGFLFVEEPLDVTLCGGGGGALRCWRLELLAEVLTAVGRWRLVAQLLVLVLLVLPPLPEAKKGTLVLHSGDRCLEPVTLVGEVEERRGRGAPAAPPAGGCRERLLG